MADCRLPRSARGTARKNFDVHRRQRLRWMQERFETLVAQFQAELIFALGVEAAMALAAGGILRALELFFDVNAGWEF